MPALDPALQAFVAAYPFATLVSPTLEVAAAPLRFTAEGKLEGHVARATAQRLMLASGASLLAIFQGPHGYVSAADYGPGAAVPTWNTVRLEARGSVKILEDEAARRRALTAQLDALESAAAQADHVTESLVHRLLPAITVFQLSALMLKSTFKLGQQKPLAAQSALATALARRGQRALSQLTDGRGGDRHVWPPFP